MDTEAGAVVVAAAGDTVVVGMTVMVVATIATVAAAEATAVGHPRLTTGAAAAGAGGITDLGPDPILHVARTITTTEQPQQQTKEGIGFLEDCTIISSHTITQSRLLYRCTWKQNQGVYY